MRLTNIYNDRRDIYLFLRKEDKTLEVKVVNSFFPYYYVTDSSGKYKSYKGIPVRKVIVSDPSEVRKQTGDNCYEADIQFSKRYMIDAVDRLEECFINYIFLDIEVMADELPDVTKADKPISCITTYNNLTNEYKTWYLPDYESEYDMLNNFVEYIKISKPDILLGWNMIRFDYPYLFNRIPDFAQNISPIKKTRYGEADILYPAGISIVDYLSWFKKITLNREKEYSLNAIAKKYLNEIDTIKVDFANINEEIKRKNINDVKRLVQLEEKKQLIPYFDKIRRLSKVNWEDMIWNSRIIDMLLLQEAKNKQIVLPMQQKELEKEDFEGAYRETFATGTFYNVGKYDLSSAYPFAVIDFCIDPSNITEETINAVNIDNTLFKQNSEAILPTVVKKLTTLKNDIKQKLATLHIDTPEYKTTKQLYEAVKTVVNSSYGVMGNRFFRLYDTKVASAVTFIVRDLLHFVKNCIEERGYKVIYVDTDSVFIESKENLTPILNKFIKNWAMQKYGKFNTNIEFAYEGSFEKVLILTMCRYLGYLRKTNGELEEEIKGIEAKRKDSTEFMKKFQRTLIDKILNQESKEGIYKWIKLQTEEIKNVPIKDIAFPCKIARAFEDYKNVPIFVRALQNTPDFNKKVGNNFYYIYINSSNYTYKESQEYLVDGKKLSPSKIKLEYKRYYGKETDKISKEIKELVVNKLEEKNRLKTETISVKDKPIDVMAFDEDNYAHITKDMIDWEKMTSRNIYMKLETIFEAMKWDINEIKEK